MLMTKEHYKWIADPLTIYDAGVFSSMGEKTYGSYLQASYNDAKVMKRYVYLGNKLKMEMGRK